MILNLNGIERKGMDAQPLEQLNSKISKLRKKGAQGVALFASKNADASINDLARDANLLLNDDAAGEAIRLSTLTV